MNKEYSPMPFSYLTGGIPPENKSTGFKKTASETGQDEAVQDSAPYSIYSGRTLQREGSTEQTKRRTLDVGGEVPNGTDPYLLSTGTLNPDKATSPGDIRNSYSEDPRYRDVVPSETDGGNVFFRHSGDGDKPGLPRSPDPDRSVAKGYTNLGADAEVKDEVSEKKLPRYVVSDDGVRQCYAGPNGEMAKIPELRSDEPKSENPIWDKYYATGGLDTAAFDVGKHSSANVRPNTRTADFNDVLRASTQPDECCCTECCRKKSSAVLFAVLLTALICLGIGFAAGWFLFQHFDDGSSASSSGSAGVTPSTSSLATSPSSQSTTVMNAIGATPEDLTTTT